MCSLKCVNIWHRALEMCVWIHAWIGVGGDGYVCFHICSKDLFLSCPRLKWSRETWWCSIHFLNSLFSFQFDLFVLGCKCQFVISWELFSVPEISTWAQGPSAQPNPVTPGLWLIHSHCVCERRAPTLMWATCLFLVSTLKTASCKSVLITGSPEGIPIDFISPLLECHSWT